VFHNECSFAAYNGKKLLWMEKGEKVLQKKGDGKTVMGTVFIRPCHGLFYKVCIEPGKNSDDYWCCESLEEQTRAAITLFDTLHPTKQGLWVFDNSANHAKQCVDGLDASLITLR
ncbi:hypothetical protein BCR33DRAFT_831666, partial [Rhizoclosmatium globosum]